MKRILFIVFFLPLFSLAQDGFVIKGTVTGIADGAPIKIIDAQDENTVVATGKFSKGTFTLKGSVPEPGLYFIQLGSEQPQHIFLENKPITITGAKKNIKDIKVSGSTAHADFEQFKKTFNPLIGELSGKAALINRESNEAARGALMKGYDSIVQIIRTEVGSFVQAKPSSYVSPFLLFVTMQVFEDPSAPEQLFNSLAEEVRTSSIGTSLGQVIARNKIGAIGTLAPEFTQADTAGVDVALSSFRGKYVLIDFWASWCGPCRTENPNLVAAYNKFKNKNFTVLGVSLDQQKEPWLAAIKKDGLTWTQLSDLQFWSNEAAALYGIQSIPQNYLLDPEGKIIAKNLRGEELTATLASVLANVPEAAPESPVMEDTVAMNTLSGTAVAMEKVGDAYFIPVLVNGQAAKAQYKSNANRITLSITDALNLQQTCAIKAEDLRGSKNFKTATGKVSFGKYVMLKEITIGGKVLKNVKARITDDTDKPGLILNKEGAAPLGTIELDASMGFFIIR